jgi:hypothetical protein
LLSACGGTLEIRFETTPEIVETQVVLVTQASGATTVPATVEILSSATMEPPTAAPTLTAAPTESAATAMPPPTVEPPPQAQWDTNPIPGVSAVQPTALISPTPTLAPEDYRDAWSAYTDNQYGFQFDYPAYYDVIGCGVRLSPPELLEVGSWNWLNVSPSNGLTLDEYVHQAIQELDQLDGPYQPAKDDARLNREPRGILVEVLIAQHSNTFVYFERDGLIYTFHARHNVGCQAPEVGIVNPAVFYQIVESFRFTK